MSDFFINIGAKLNLSAVAISPSIKNTLAALSKNASGTIKQKYQLDFDVGSIGKVSSAANDLIEGLQKTVSKTKISPTQIMDQGELTDALGQLGLVKPVLESIRAAMFAIQKNSNLIPNAKQEFGRLALLERVIKGLRQEADKGIKIQTSVELEPVRKFDQQIIAAGSNVENLKKRIEQLKADQIKVAADALKASSASATGRQVFSEKVRIAKTTEADRPKIVAELKAEAEAKAKALRDAEAKLSQSRPTEKAIKIAESDVTKRYQESQAAKTAFEKAQAKQAVDIAPLLQAKEAADKAKAAAEQAVLKTKQEKFIESKPQQKELRPQIKAVGAAETELKRAEQEFEKISRERNQRIAALEKAAKDAAAAYDEAAKKYDAANQGKKKNIPQRTAALADVSKVKSEATAALDAAKIDTARIAAAESNKKAASELVAEAQRELDAKKQTLITAANISVEAADIAKETTAATAATKKYNEALTQANASVSSLGKKWEEASRAETNARNTVEDLRKRSKDTSSSAYSTAVKERDEAKAALKLAEARVGIVDVGGVDQQLLRARKSEKQAQSRLAAAEKSAAGGVTPSASDALKTELGSAIAELQKAVALEKEKELAIAKQEADYNDQVKTAKALLAQEQKILAIQQQRAREKYKASLGSEVQARQADYDKAAAAMQSVVDDDKARSDKQKDAIEKANQELQAAQKAYNQKLEQFRKDSFRKRQPVKDRLRAELEASPERDRLLKAESAVFSASRGGSDPRETAAIAQRYAAAKEAVDKAKEALDIAKQTTSAMSEQEAVTKATATNLARVTNYEENLRAIEGDRQKKAVAAEQAKTEAVNRRINAEKALNKTLASRVDESRKDLQVEKGIKQVVTEITKVVVEAEAAKTPAARQAAEKRLGELTGGAASTLPLKQPVDRVAQAKADLEAATKARIELEDQSAKLGGLQAKRLALIKLARDEQSARESVAAVDREIEETQKRLVSAEANFVKLQEDQKKARADLNGNLQKDKALRQEILALVEKTVQEEKGLQRRVGKSLSNVGITPNLPDPRERALQRLAEQGINRESLESPTPDLVKQLKNARQTIRGSRDEELVATLSRLDQGERQRLVQKRLEDLDRLETRSIRRRIITSTGGSDELSVRADSTAREAEDRRLRNRNELASRMGSATFDFPDLNTLSLAQSEQLLREINSLLRRRKAEHEQDLALAQERNRVNKASQRIEKIIEDEIKKEVAARIKIRDALQRQGYEFDIRTGQARQVTAQGLGPARQIIPAEFSSQAGSIRAGVLRRLGVASYDDDLAERGRVPIVANLRGQEESLRREAGTSAEQRRSELESARNFANQERRVESFVTELGRLVRRQIDLENRRAASTRTVARGAEAITADVVGQAAGGGARTISEARDRARAFSLAEETAATQRLTRATETQNEALRAQRNLEQQQERVNRDRARYIDRLNRTIEQTTRALEEQVRAVNRLARAGAGGNNALRPIQINQEQLRETARRSVLGNRTEEQLASMSPDALRNLDQSSQRGLRNSQAQLRQFNDDVRAVTQGSKSGFEIMARYGENAFERLGGKIGYATEKLAAYAFGGAGLYGVISATRAAIVETALLEKEITNIQQIFDSGTIGEAFDEGTSSVEDLARESSKAALAASQSTKTAILNISSVTGQSAIEIAKAAKDLAAAGFGRGTPGFEETIRAISFAQLGPSFGSLEQIIDGLIASVNQFNQSLTATPYILGLVNEFSKAYAVEAQDLFEAVKRGGGAFAAVGGSFEEFLTLVTIAREKTRESAPVIGTFLKTLSGRLYTPQAESLFNQLDIDLKKAIDPAQRLFALAEKLSEKNLGPGSTQLLSRIVDSRSVGRLYSLLEGIQAFVKENRVDIESLRESAINSITRDARARLDDLGITLDRIRASYFRLVEGIYNNPATKALLRIPSGIGAVLSKAPEVGIGNFTVGNFVNPLIQSGLVVGLVGVIRGAIQAFTQNGTAVRLNTQALTTLRTAVEQLQLRLGGTLLPPVAGAPGGGVNRGVLSRLTGLNNPIRDIIISSVIPALTNSILPYTNISQDNQNIISSSVTGGSFGYLIGALASANPYVRAGVTVGGALLGGASAAAEQRSREVELKKLEKETRRAQKQEDFQRILNTGEIPNVRIQDGKAIGGVSVVAATEESEALIGVFQKLRKQGSLNVEQQKALVNAQRNVLGIASREEKVKFEENTALAALKLAGFDKAKVPTIREGFETTSARARDFIERRFLKNAESINADTIENRIAVIKKTAEELSKDKGLFDVAGFQLDASLIEENLAGTFLVLEDQTKVLLDGTAVLSDGQRVVAQDFVGFKQQLLGFSAGIRSFKDQSEIAGKTLEALGNALANSIKKQTFSVQSIIDDSKKVFANFETIKGLLTSPFRFTQIQQIQNLPTQQNAEKAVATIESLTGVTPINPASEEISRFSGLLNRFFVEFTTNKDADLRASVIKSFSQESLKGISSIVATGVLGEDTGETRFKGESARVSPMGIATQIKETFGDLERLGPAGKELFELIQRTGVRSDLPFDIQKIPEALQSGDINAAEKLLNITDSRNNIIEQANNLIAAQNEQLDQQLKAIESLISANQERINTEISLGQFIADNVSALNSYKLSAGFLTAQQAGEANAAAQQSAVSVANQFVGNDITGFADAINELKNVQIEFDRFRLNSAAGVSIPGQTAGDIGQRVQNVETLINDLGYAFNLFGGSNIETIANIAGARQILENEIRNFETRGTIAFKALGQELDNVSRKIQSQRSVIDSVINKVFSGSGAESAAAKATLQRASQNIDSIFKEILSKVPNFAQLSASEILANQDVAQIAQRSFQQLAPIDFNAIKELLAIAGENQFTGTGVSGIQGLAAMQSGFASMTATLTGLNVSFKDIQANVNNATAVLARAEQVNADLIQARTELTEIVKNNAQIMSTEVTNLTKAIAAIPKEIRIVIGGLENINVGFDLTNVDASMKKIGDQVLIQITNRLRAAFAKNNMPLPE